MYTHIMCVSTHHMYVHANVELHLQSELLLPGDFESVHFADIIDGVLHYHDGESNETVFKGTVCTVCMYITYIFLVCVYMYSVL